MDQDHRVENRHWMNGDAIGAVGKVGGVIPIGEYCIIDNINHLHHFIQFY